VAFGIADRRGRARGTMAAVAGGRAGKAAAVMHRIGTGVRTVAR